MNRRAFGKVLGILAGAIGVGKMPASDLLARVADGQRLNRIEIDALKESVRRLEGLESAGNLTDGSGGLHGNVFNGRQFSVLPHETGGMYSHNNDIQSVPKTTLTTVEFQDTNEGPHVQWSEGGILDFTNHSIKLASSPAGAIWYLSGMTNWGQAMAAGWSVGFIDSVSGRSVTTFYSVDGIGWFSSVLQTESPGSNWTMAVYHSEAANKDLDSAWFSATRLR